MGAKKTSAASAAALSLSPPRGSWRGRLLFINRASRCVLVSLVPLVGIYWALPQVLALLRRAPLCIEQSGRWLPGQAVVRTCTGKKILQRIRLRDWPHYALCLWSGIQFVYNFVESCFKCPGFSKKKQEAADGGKARFPVRFLDAPHEGKGDKNVYYFPRWCDYCESWKPPRAHHSKRVGRCVLRMDHYCVVTENIIGARNHGNFVLMVGWACIGLSYGLFLTLRVFYVLWDPYWSIFSKLSEVAVRRQSFWYWVATGAHVHALKALVGWEIPCWLFFLALSWMLIGPLAKQVLIASKGDTVLESQNTVNDALEIPDETERVLILEKGAFSKGSRLLNLRLLLGPRWRQRLLCPVRGGVDVLEETSPQLSQHYREAFADFFEDTQKID